MPKRRKKSSPLEEWLGSAAVGVFVLDNDRVVRVFNHGCETLTGWQASEVIGEAGHYGSVSELAGAAALAASLCPPPEAFAGQPAMAPAQLVHKDGHVVPRVLHYFPLRDEKERQTGVLGVVMPASSAPPARGTSPSRALHAELAALRMQLRSRFGLHALVAHCPAMRRALAQVELAQQTAAAVLLTGEAGTGKEHLARVIHFGGPAKTHWFVPLDCRRQSADELDRVWYRLIEARRTPAAGSPQPGTVYFSDVELLPRDFQERVVHAFAPSESSRASAPRLMAGTTSDLAAAVAAQSVRADFHALVSPLTIAVPSLRERGDDLPLLAQHFLEEMNRQEPKQVGGFDEKVWPAFARYTWPGNLDELAAVVREAHATASESLVRAGDLPYRFRAAIDAQDLPPALEPPPMHLEKLLTRVEAKLISLALARSKNNRSKAAELLGINRARLLRRIEQLGLSDEREPADEPDRPIDPRWDAALSEEPLDDPSPPPGERGASAP